MRTNWTVQPIAAVLLIAASVACADHATAPKAAVVTRLEPATSTSMAGVVGTTIAGPSVIVRDQNGSPVKGVPVRFVQFGGGGLRGGDVLSDETGKASAGVWTLPLTAGVNTVAAILADLRVDFHVTALAGAATEVVKIAGDQQFGSSQAPTPFPQTVFVKDRYGNAVASAAVSFAVTAGGGTLAGGSALVTTDARGLAQFSGWTLGSEGPQALAATVVGLEPAVFSAAISGDGCNSFSPLPNGSSPLLLLSSFPCSMPDGRIANFYSYKVDAGRVYSFEVLSADFDGVLTLQTKDGRPVAEKTGTPAGNAAFTAFLTPGDYVLSVTTKSAAQGGAYRLAANASIIEQRKCQEVFLTVGASISQDLGKGDCETTPGVYVDRFRMYLAAGSKVSVTMSSPIVDSSLLLADAAGYVYAGSDSGYYDGVLGAQLSFIAPKSGYYLITATTEYSIGEYTLSVK